MTSRSLAIEQGGTDTIVCKNFKSTLDDHCHLESKTEAACQRVDHVEEKKSLTNELCIDNPAIEIQTPPFEVVEWKCAMRHTVHQGNQKPLHCGR
jgi:hypothetical protein